MANNFTHEDVDLLREVIGRFGYRPGNAQGDGLRDLAMRLRAQLIDAAKVPEPAPDPNRREGA